MLRYSHQYPDKLVWLDLWTVTAWTGDVRSLDGQQLRWVAVAALPGEDILEADRPMIEALLGRGR